ncbi:hypothetical protein DXB51_17220 [Bacillus cereus]|uniref:DUF3953 domain-containing protein n=1 Tax=Bacillus luti TaxID=2026191 RepID=A0ABU8HRG9_9BACI|nr:hypothetical protein [Bacillus luti]RGN76599.1 hypothetical protein DXB51_17220 [Bacillus cereus]
MLKTLRIISALIVIALALFGMFTNALVTLPYTLIALSIMSTEEKQKQKKVHSTLSFFSGVFTLIVAIIIFVSR